MFSSSPVGRSGTTARDVRRAAPARGPAPPSCRSGSGSGGSCPGRTAGPSPPKCRSVKTGRRSRKKRAREAVQGQKHSTSASTRETRFHLLHSSGHLLTPPGGVCPAVRGGGIVHNLQVRPLSRPDNAPSIRRLHRKKHLQPRSKPLETALRLRPPRPVLTLTLETVLRLRSPQPVQSSSKKSLKCPTSCPE